MSVVVAGGMLIYSLLHLMLVLVLYVVVLLLRLSHIVLTFIRTKLFSGSFQVKNKYLEEVLQDKGLKKDELTALWKDIAGNEGSVQHLDILTDDEKEIFKTANEIDQIWIVEHAAKRQEFICQAQSVNLFFTLPKATEPQEVHDEYMQYVNDVHWYGMNKLKVFILL